MVYLYTMDNCPKCEKKKKEFIANNINFEERDSNRIKAPQDDIDQEALVQASFQNLEFPVIISDTNVQFVDINDFSKVSPNEESVHLKFKTSTFKEKK